MKRVIAVLIAAVVIAAVALVAVTSAPAATPLERRVTTLQRQVTTLQRQVRTLQRQTRELRDFAGAMVAVNACVLAITSDAVQGTWTTMNQSEGRALFPTAQTLNDRGACSALRVQRQPTLVPPVISPFSSLLILLTGQSSALPPR